MNRAATAFRAEWNRPSDRYGAVGLARNLLPLLGLLSVAPWLAARSPWLPWLLAPAVGLFLYRLTIVMHDCLHGTLFGRRSMNRSVGELLGALTGIDFGEFRRRHLEHHRIFGQPGDPQGFHYFGIARMTRLEFAWHLLRPLAGLNLPHVFAESVLHPANLTRSVRSGRILVLLTVQLGVALLVTSGGRHPWLILLLPLSAATFGLFFSQARGIAEHGLSEDAGQPGFVRSHASTLFDRLLLSDLNFHLHSEHHGHPAVPSRHLPALRAASGGMVESGGMWHTIRSLVR